MFSKADGETIFFLTVSVTRDPNKKAPKNSKTAAIQTAWNTVKDLAPTEVAKAFATSLAPIPNAVKKDAIHPNTKIHS